MENLSHSSLSGIPSKVLSGNCIALNFREKLGCASKMVSRTSSEADEWQKALAHLEKMNPLFKAQWTKVWAQRRDVAAAKGQWQVHLGSKVDRSNPQEYHTPKGLDRAV